MKRLTIERTTEIILFVLIFALATRIPLDPDTWWHIRSGEYTLTQGMIYTDPFSLTMRGEAWTNHSWGAQIILYGMWRLAGDFGLAVFTAALATAGMVVIYRMCAGSVYVRAFALIGGAAVAASFWSPRPQMLSFFLSAVVLYILHLCRRKQIDRLWWLPPIMALWGNLHAGFSIGFIFLAGTIAGETLGRLFTPNAESGVSWRGIGRLLLITIVSAAALVLNPYGLNMLLVPFQTVSIGALQDVIFEWNSPDFHNPMAWPFAALLLGLLGAVGASGRRLNWTDFVLTAGTAFMGLLAGRNLAVFAVVATPVLTIHLDSALTERGWNLQPLRRVSQRMALVNVLLLLVVIIGALAKVFLVLDPKLIEEAKQTYLPVEAVEHLRQSPPAALFNSYNWGGYLMFALPDVPVFVDGRTDLYGDRLLPIYLEAAGGGPGWHNTLSTYDIDTVMIEPDSGLATALRVDSGWTMDYEDDLAVIFRRVDAHD